MEQGFERDGGVPARQLCALDRVLGALMVGCGSRPYYAFAQTLGPLRRVRDWHGRGMGLYLFRTINPIAAFWTMVMPFIAVSTAMMFRSQHACGRRIRCNCLATPC